MTPITIEDANPLIKVTKDYSVFKPLQGNRNLNQAHIKRLIQSISEDALCIRYTPILVNEEHQIIDGQHRLEALKKLSLPVYFIQEEGLDIKNAQSLNALARPWSPVDYAKSYSDLGNKNYKYYLDFKNTFQLNHDILMRYLSLNNPITGEMFRNGKLKVKNVAESEDLCAALMDIGKYYPRFKIRTFALAFKTVWENEKYDHKRLIMKLEQNPHAIEDRALPEDYVRDIESLYNHGLETNKKVRFF